jgi:ATP-dependent Clp protease ATP-binding subunit ClpA
MTIDLLSSLLTFLSTNPILEELIFAVPILEVIIIIVFLKSTLCPRLSVNWPSSNICNNKLKTSGCPFSISSNKTIEYGFLTEKVRRNPYSIVLFDEIEKGHPDVFNLLLQILDEGQLTDSLGHNVDFKNTLIIMTSNIGTANINSSNIGFVDKKVNKEDNKSIVMKEVKKYFKPEFLNRLDDIIIFNQLTLGNLYKIIDFEMMDLKNNLKNKNIALRLNKSAKKILLQEGSFLDWGARPIRRVIQNRIESSNTKLPKL